MAATVIDENEELCTATALLLCAEEGTEEETGVGEQRQLEQVYPREQTTFVSHCSPISITPFPQRDCVETEEETEETEVEEMLD